MWARDAKNRRDIHLSERKINEREEKGEGRGKERKEPLNG